MTISSKTDAIGKWPNCTPPRWHIEQKYSLQATWIRNTILHALRGQFKLATRNIPSNFVYANPTIRLLGRYVARTADTAQEGVALQAGFAGKIKEMEALVKKYTTDFPSHRPSVGAPQHEVVLLTGTTGGFGSYILETLLRDPAIFRVYALNRGDMKNKRSLNERQRAAFMNRGIDVSYVRSPKLILLEGDAALPSLGLPPAVLRGIQESITCIIHNGMAQVVASYIYDADAAASAWRVDFNVAL
jgi:hypothetical protein